LEPSPSLDTPVVLLVFNRPDTTRKVLGALRKVRPGRVYVVADGPRAERPDDARLCAETRRVIEEIDWPCRVETDYAAHNLGCMRRVSSGLDWVFERVEEAIILEDDCLPDVTFFRFCAELLAYYRDRPEIAQIGGVNFQFGQQQTPDSYYFSRYNHVWGWATWRRAWRLNDNAMAAWPAFRRERGLHRVLSGTTEIQYWTWVLDEVAAGRIDSWACRWTLSCWRHGLKTVLPGVNLVTNIGFDPAATHTRDAENCLAGIAARAMDFPLRHPQQVTTCPEADARTAGLLFRQLGWRTRFNLRWRGLWSR